MQTHANAESGRTKKRTNKSKAGMENPENDEPISRAKKARKSRVNIPEESSDSEGLSELAGDESPRPVEPSRRSGRLTKRTEPLREAETTSDSESDSRSFPSLARPTESLGDVNESDSTKDTEILENQKA